MDGNPWGSAWAEPERETVQEVTLKPKADTWLTSPASGDLGVAWSSTTQWGTRTDTQTTWKPAPTTFDSETAPWGSSFEVRAADVLGGLESSRSLEPTPLKEVFDDQHDFASAFSQPRDVNVVEEINAEPQTTPDELAAGDEKPTFVAQFEAQEDESPDRWRALENAAITVGNDAAWETAWKPDADEEDTRAESPTGPPADDWTEAVQQRALRDAKVPPEVMDMIFTRYRELEKSMWPEEDLEAAREGPAPRSEWQGGLENVEGLTALTNRYLPPNTSAPPIHFDTTKIAASFRNAMKLTKSYGMIQKSPLNRLIRTSESWEQSARSGGGSAIPFSLESWLSTRGSSALSMASPYVSGSGFPETESQRKAAGLLGGFSRSSIDRGRTSSSGSPTPRASQDGMPSIMSIAASAGSSTIALSPTNRSESPAQAGAPSAVTRFLNRFSRRAEDTPKQPTAVNLRSDELDFLDMMPAMNTNGVIADAIQKELESAGGYPGLQALGVGSSIVATPTPSRQGMLDSRPVNRLSSTVNLGQITSKDFDALLDAQMMEVEDEKMRESLVAASFISAPTDSRYSKLNIPLFGSKPLNAVQPLSNSGSAQSNTLLDDDDDFDAFLSSSTPSQAPAHARKPSQPSIIPSAFGSTPSSFSTQNIPSTFVRTGTPPNVRPGSTKVSPTPSRGPTVAIMSQTTGSSVRATTPATMTTAPLLPPPPGSRQLRSPPIHSQGDLLNDSVSVSPQTQATSAATMSTKTTQMETLFGLSSPPVSMVSNSVPVVAPKRVTPSVTPAPGGLSAQDLSFFEGL